MPHRHDFGRLWSAPLQYPFIQALDIDAIDLGTSRRRSAALGLWVLTFWRGI